MGWGGFILVGRGVLLLGCFFGKSLNKTFSLLSVFCWNLVSIFGFIPLLGGRLISSLYSGGLEFLVCVFLFKSLLWFSVDLIRFLNCAGLFFLSLFFLQVFFFFFKCCLIWFNSWFVCGRHSLRQVALHFGLFKLCLWLVQPRVFICLVRRCFWYSSGLMVSAIK